MSLLKLLAKTDPDISLEQHLLDTFTIAKDLLDNKKEKALNYSALIAATFHDIGKADDTFQQHIRGKGKGEPHPLMALPIIESILANIELDRYYKDLILLSVVSHHTPLHDELYLHKNPRLIIKEKSEFEDIINKLCNQLSIHEPNFNEVYRTKPKKVLILAKDRIFNYEGDKNKLREDFIYIQGILEQSDWLASSKEEIPKLEIPKLVSKNYDYQDLALRSIGNIFITLPTGAGKTETALYWAKANYNYISRVFYILPTITTINSMFKRLKRVFNGVGEYHSNVDLFLDLEGDNALDNELIMYKYYFMPLNVTTPDQLLLSLMNYKKFTLKSFPLYNAAIILDEIHVYDSETFSLIKFMIKYLSSLYNTRFCIMSATFPNKLKEELYFLNAKDLVTQKDIERYYKNKKRTYIKFNDNTIDEIIGEIIDSAKLTETVVVVNTVKRAQDLYIKIKNEGDITNIELLHSRYIFKDRRKKEEMLTNDKKPRLLIATQLVEVSLDISYNNMFTEACYIDSLIQRTGRINRYNEYKEPRLINVLRPIDYHPYDKKLLETAMNIIVEEEGNINSEFDYLRITNRFYDEIWDDIKIESDNRFYYVWNKCKYLYSIDLRDEEAQELLTTRKGIISIPAIPIEFRDHISSLQDKLKTNNDIREKINLRREQRKYLVNVPLIKEFKDKLYTERIYDNYFTFVNAKYDEELGLTGLVDNII
ncbi:MAG: CRISPR-associated helicase/endonuclease Cas3 [Candidatus Nitrosocaldaceae archaeon]|nr:MAG: CRISPR-associated helicase/endonuclease Cas3 [Candidatus Nitrosocaldaceae archaeon]